MKHRFWLLTICCMLCFLPNAAAWQSVGNRTIDSLIRRIPDLMRRNEDSARTLIRDLARQAEVANHRHGIIQSAFFRSWLSYRHDPADSAIAKIDSALNHIEGIETDSAHINFYILKGQCFVKKTQFGPALTEFNKALKIAEQRNDLQSRIGTMISIGWAYMEDGKPAEAITFFSDVLKLNNDKSFSSRSLLLCNIAACYNSLGNYAKAETSAREAISVARERKNNMDLANGLNILARSLYHQQRLQPAINYLKEAAIIREKVADPSMLASDYLELADMYSKNQQHALALPWAKKAEAISQNQSNALKLGAAYTSLAGIYEQLSDFKKSSEYLKKSLVLKDSLDKDQYNQAMARMQIQFETQKKTAENLELKKENLEARLRNVNQQRWLLALAAAILLVAGAGIYISHVQKNKYRSRMAAEKLAEQKARTLAVMEAEEKERRRIAADLHDGVGQVLAAASMHIRKLLNGQQGSLEMDELINRASTEVRAISHQVTPELLLQYGLKRTLEQEISRLNMISANLQFRLYVFETQPLQNDLIALTLYRCFQELISNILKHAAAEEVTVHLNISESEVELIVEDDGVGFIPGQKTSLGMNNLNSRVAIFDGSFIVDSIPGKGTTTIITIPLPKHTMGNEKIILS